MRVVRLVAIAILLVLGRAVTTEASPNEPPGLNLGGTSFMDGFGRTDPGFVYQQYFQVEHFNAINDENGHALPNFQGTNITTIISLNQLIYVAPAHLFGGSLGFDALLPVIDLNASFASTSPSKLRADSGVALGDLTWGPFLQMPPVIVDGRAVFAQRFEFDVISPTGQYNHADDINPSCGFWSLNPFWAVTVLPTPKTEFSFRLHYLHNFQDNDPAGGAAPFRAGDAIWVNFAASYNIIPKLYVGLNGYFFQQIQNDTVNGEKVPNSETTNLSLGPGLMYEPQSHDTFYFNAYLPVTEINTTHGIHLVFRWIHVF